MNVVHFFGACAACGKPSEGQYSIHRDGFNEGPEVPLCNGCGAEETPTLQELWRRIADRRRPSSAKPRGDGR